LSGAPIRELYGPLLSQAAAHAQRYLAMVPERPVGPLLSADALRDMLRRPLSEPGEDARLVIDQLAQAGLGGTVASQGPRYFGFVNGGSLPVATAADWLVSAWDQNAQVFVMSPIASVVEDIAAGWLKGLFEFPQEWSVGFVTGAQMATFTGLLAARHYLLEKVGWDVEGDGLTGAPPIDVIISDESHRTILTALRMLGLGDARVRRVETDSQGRMRADRLALALRSAGKSCLVCAQAGNVNTGATDPLATIAALTRDCGAWLHVDGAFGLWARASPEYREQVAGIERADSIAADGHKWLNLPYDSGLVFTAHPDAHRRALTISAHYIQLTPGERDPRVFTPDESRRARGVPVYAALRTLGRQGVADLVARYCGHAQRMAAALGRHPQVRILNEVVLNQVLVQFVPPAGDPRDAAAFTDRVVLGIQQEGTCWLGPTLWHGVRAARISICNWSTTESDIDRSAAAILAVIDQTNRHI
jgi:glutamate/tyrosine decarboxylase-like PLP-dependent enzyme